MGNLVPSVLLYSQAIGLLEEIEEAQATGAVKDTFDLVQQLAAILTSFQDSVGTPLLNYDPVSESEPPSSEKANRFWKNAEKDINLLQQQVDILRASVLFGHNLVSTELMHAKKQNARVNNKLKTMQMYTNGYDSSIIQFGDSFRSLEFVDTEIIDPQERVGLFFEGYVTLGQEGEMLNLSEKSTVKILNTSNGFLGNNQEIDDRENAPIDPETGDPFYTFKAELRTYDDLGFIVDNAPNTWIEYERYEVSSSHRLSANGYNFTYTKESEEGNIEHVDWATAPDNNVLRLGLEFDMGELRNLNSVEFTPHGLEDNINYPVLVRRIQTSPNGTDWTPLFPTNVWIGTNVNLTAARTADNVVSHKALWAFESRAVRYVRVFIEQHHSIDSDVGHPYWVDRRNPELRVEGPIPPEDDPTKFYSRRVVGEQLQLREYFPGKRWAIGIRDILLQQVEYKPKSIMITKPLRVGGLIDRVMLEKAEIEVPPGYPPDESWVNFYISPDDGENWFPIARIDDVFLGIPHQISFNDPIHESLRERTVKNHNTDLPVTSIRLKAELTRPAEMRSTTPILKSYSLKVKRR
jgi:hypothetical protein